jgi:hypothetical protein
MVGATLRQGIHQNNARSVCEFLLDEHLRHSSPDQSFATALGLALCVGGSGAADALVPVWYVTTICADPCVVRYHLSAILGLPLLCVAMASWPPEAWRTLWFLGMAIHGRIDFPFGGNHNPKLVENDRDSHPMTIIVLIRFVPTIAQRCAPGIVPLLGADRDGQSAPFGSDAGRILGEDADQTGRGRRAARSPASGGWWLWGEGGHVLWGKTLSHRALCVKPMLNSPGFHAIGNCTK